MKIELGCRLLSQARKRRGAFLRRRVPGNGRHFTYGACCAVVAPLLSRIEAHVFAAERLHGDDTTVPVLAKGKTDTRRCWVYVRDDRPFGGQDPPAAMFYYSRDRAGEQQMVGYWRPILRFPQSKPLRRACAPSISEIARLNWCQSTESNAADRASA